MRNYDFSAYFSFFGRPFFERKVFLEKFESYRAQKQNGKEPFEKILKLSFYRYMVQLFACVFCLFNGKQLLSNHVQAVFFLFLSAFAMQNAALKADSPFEFEAVDLGVLRQGIKKNVEIKGKNTSSQTIKLENVFDQMTGGENFIYPKTIAAGQNFKINFTLNTAYMEGNFFHNIVLVDTNGTAWIALVRGSVENPIVFSVRILDLGYYKKGTEKTWVFYAWNAENKPLKLKLSPFSQKEFKAKFSNVKLDVKDFENIKEGGTTPAVKISLSVVDLENSKSEQKSIRKIVSFICENFPNATPELLVTGYWE